jgi:hypothetical protein
VNATFEGAIRGILIEGFRIMVKKIMANGPSCKWLGIASSELYGNIMVMIGLIT